MRSRRIRITSIKRDPIDYRKLARALIALARARREVQAPKEGHE